MKGSKKVLITTVAVVGLSLGSISAVSAFGGPGGYGGCDRGYGQKGPNKMMQKRGSGFNMEEKMAERLDYMKYKLKITEKQEPAWQEFTKVLESKFTNMRERKENRGEQKTITEKVKQMRAGAESMTQMADAMEKLYSTLTPEQQKIADEMSPMGKRTPRMRGF
jgi:hypothetical protein